MLALEDRPMNKSCTGSSWEEEVQLRTILEYNPMRAEVIPNSSVTMMH